MAIRFFIVNGNLKIDWWYLVSSEVRKWIPVTNLGSLPAKASIKRLEVVTESKFYVCAT